MAGRQAPCDDGATMNDGELTEALARWRLDLPAVWTRVYQVPTPRERERWHALWLLARGWTVADVAAALERDPHTVGDWCAVLGLSRDIPGSYFVKRQEPVRSGRPAPPCSADGSGGNGGGSRGSG